MIGRNEQRRAGFTFVEILVSMGLCAVFSAGLMVVWSSLSFNALNTTAFSTLQNDQMRVLDYLKRDIHRATKVELFNGSTLVTDLGVAASRLRLTLPDYYADTREDDAAFGSRAANTPVLQDANVKYGTPFTVEYFVSNGACMRREGAISRPLTGATPAFAFTFTRETSGAIRGGISFDQPMRNLSAQKLRRSVATRCVPRTEFR